MLQFIDPLDPDGEAKRIMEEYDLDDVQAESVLEIMDEWGVDEDEAVEIEEEFG